MANAHSDPEGVPVSIPWSRGSQPVQGPLKRPQITTLRLLIFGGLPTPDWPQTH